MYGPRIEFGRTGEMSRSIYAGTVFALHDMVAMPISMPTTHVSRCPYCGVKQEVNKIQTCTQCGGGMDARVL